ncbi:MAG TPA: GAF and ANTAR domain-containing protein [Actinomycetota bacterium]|nr:GAF and ANTAR domain-containing protein [Actinomycetota bacterium]
MKRLLPLFSAYRRRLGPIESDLEARRSDLASSFAEIARGLYSAHTVKETLDRIVDASVRTIDGCSGAGISFIQNGDIVTPVWTEPTVVEVDEMQYTTGQGPCLDAITHGETFYAEDLRTDTRWPDFGPRAAAAGLRSLMSFCLAGEATLGALNLYARRPRAFGATDRAMGLILATHAGVALAAAVELEDATKALEVETKRLQNLQGALFSRQVIGRAEGILMNRERITGDQAFDLLRRASQQLNIKLREIAQHVVDTGEIPDRPGDAP